MTPRKFHDIESLLEEVVTLPSMPDTVAKVMWMLDNPECALADVADVIALDPSITVKTLRLVNSAFYGLGTQVTTVRRAVALLGGKVIRNLVLSATIFNSLQEHPGSFIRHSIAVGVAMRSLATVGPLKNIVESPEEAFVYGLIHDIGKTLFSTFLAEEYREVEYFAIIRKMPWRDAEREVLGIDHAAMGGALARHWKLNPVFADVISGHHDLEQCPSQHQIIAANLCVADFIANKSGLSAYRNPVLEMPESIWPTAGLDSTTLPPILEHFFNMTPEVDLLVRSF